MDVTREKRDWDELANVDPLGAILALPERRGTPWTPQEFFETGERELAAVLDVARALERPHRWETALDFGCGVGRVTRAAAGRFRESYGVDISSQMIEEAKTLNADVGNCTFLVNDAPDLARFQDATFDFVFSNRVLQHLPGRDAILAYIREFLRVVRDDGLVVFHLPTVLRWRNRLQPRPRVYKALRALGVSTRWLYDAAALHPVRMRAIPERDVRVAVAKQGGVVARVEPADPGGPVIGLMYYVHRRA